MRKPGLILRKFGLILLLAALTALVTIGCGTDDPKPAITRLYASATCGVAPLRVDFRADATGGASLPDPTGGNNWLRMSWDFGDGTVIEDGTSIAFHQYTLPDTYTVTITAEDDNGERAQRSTEIIVQADSLSIEIFGLVDDAPVTQIEACRPLQLDVVAETCGFDPVADSYERFVFLWAAGDSIYRGTHPRHSFSSADAGMQEITVVLEDPTRSITRFDTLLVEVLPSGGADLSLTVDWLASPQGTASPVLDRDVPAFPDTLTYTVHLLNDGPVDAYNLQVVGTLDGNNRIVFDDRDFSSGEFRYVAVENGSSVKRWTWNVEQVTAGGEETIDISFILETAPAGAVYSGFDTALDAYPCDPDSDDIDVSATLNIVTAP